MHFDQYAPMPAVTFCNLNALSAARLNASGLDNDAIVQWYPDTFTEAEVSELSQPPEEFLLDAAYCVYGRMPCELQNFTRTFDAQYGECWTFTPHVLRRNADAQHSGEANGLRMLFHVDTQDYQVLQQLQGIKVAVHLPEVHAQLSAGVNVGPGTHAALAVQQRTVRTTHDCSTTLAASYTVEHCTLGCLSDAIVRACNCSESQPHGVLTAPRCVNDTAVECEADVYEQWALSELAASCNCPTPCDSIGYELVGAATSVTAWPSASYADVLASELGTTAQSIRDDYVSVNVFMAPQNVFSIGSQPVEDTSTVLAHVGGLFALFCGISLLTVFEALEWVLRLGVAACCCCGSKHRRRRTRPSTPLSGMIIENTNNTNTYNNYTNNNNNNNNVTTKQMLGHGGGGGGDAHGVELFARVANPVGSSLSPLHANMALVDTNDADNHHNIAADNDDDNEFSYTR
jgi:hypothetical protein